eukprot:TRINITY_DN63190_c0_g1_i1.p1 TRINITY_DN63190_c0_g1~~TRINITY_DN63190_c0_g1_i1.p1  ORF type:complete len:968 (-),score=155.32 TRINITY_DN63190_c0_g1_i1:54-2792(-)
MDSDVMVKALEKSNIHSVLKAARASLAEPSRPFTPLDRSLFQMADSPGSTTRPNSGYSVDQLSFVKDTFGRPQSTQSSKSGHLGRYEAISEEAGSYRREGTADILRLGDGSSRQSPQDSEAGCSSSEEELTPVVSSSSLGGTTSSQGRSTKPPRPPGFGGSGYGGFGSSSATNLRSSGYPDPSASSSMVERSPKRKQKRHASEGRRKDRTSSSDPSLGAGADVSSTPSGTASRRSRSASKGATPEEQWDASCEATIAKLQALSEAEERKNMNPEAIFQLADRVWEIVEGIQVGKGTKADKFAPVLLRAVLGLLDLKDAKCVFRLSRCALALLLMEGAVKGVHSSGVQAAYLNIAKVLFKYSKVEGHDVEFLSEGLLAPLLEVLKSNAPECVVNDLRVYIVGVLKNISIEEGNQKALVQQGAVPALFGLMDASQLTGSVKEAQLLIQITATLRSLAGHGYKQFIPEDRLNALTRIMELFPSNLELLTNISRALAKLTLHNSACEAYAKNDAHIRQITKTLSANADHAPLALRLSFVLGNLTAKSDRLRVVFAFDCEGTSLTPQLLGKYWQRDRQLTRLRLDGATTSGLEEIEEVLVKLVRLIANIAISSSAGTTLAASSAVVDPLLDMLGAKRIGDSEELVLNVVAAVTNLLFYDVPSNILFEEEHKQLLCRLFRPLLLESYNVEALIETARALGNLSRHADARRCMAGLRLDEVLVILLDHDDRDLVYYVCGALVNFAADPECTLRLTTVCPTVQRLGKLLQDAYQEHETSLQFVAVKVLTNLSLDAGSTWSVAGTEDVRSALQQISTAAGAPQSAGVDTESEQLLELSQHLLEMLPAAPEDSGSATPNDAGVGVASGGKNGAAIAKPTGNASEGATDSGVFVCTARGCGRTFTSEAKLSAHMMRRHAERSA